MRLPQSGGDGSIRDPDVGRAVPRRAIELGVNHVDTTDLYQSPGGIVHVNTLIRETRYPYPQAWSPSVLMRRKEPA